MRLGAVGESLNRAEGTDRARQGREKTQAAGCAATGRGVVRQRFG